jgi:hypothetical protein
MVLKQIEENEKEKVYKEEVREQENAAMFDYMQKLQEKDWEDFSKRKDSQKKLAVNIHYHLFHFYQNCFIFFSKTC